MQNRGFSFLVAGRPNEVIVTYLQNSLKVVSLSPETLAVCQQVYSEGNLPAVSNGPSLKKVDELYTFLASARSSGDRWAMSDATTLIVTAYSGSLKLALKPVSDALEMSRIAVLRALVGAGENKVQEQGTQQEILSLRSGYNNVGTKLKGIGELFEQLHQSNDNHTKLITEISQRLTICETRSKEIEGRMRQLQSKNEQSMNSMRLSIDISAKTMHRNLLTLKEGTDKSSEEVKAELARIDADIKQYDFMRIRREYDQIIHLFDREIKVKDYQFVPEEALLVANRKLHWLNKRTLKNLEDLRDYNKTAGELPFPPGISKMRILVHTIKNNGLLMGVCSRKVKESLANVAFNDQGIISLNSCGYLTNRGAMVMTGARIKQGDTVKMQVNLSQGVIEWFCNDVEVAVADMGALNKEEVFPVIGLGFFGDEVEILDSQAAKKAVDVMHETYAKELQKMNEKFGSRHRP